MTDDVVRWHLSGQDDRGKNFVVGVYPMLLDETCFFLVADFDKSSWKEDALAFLKTCCDLKIPATTARKLGSYILTETMESYPDIGLDSYDPLVPNQDTLPRGGFGNLIALPLQRKARDQDNNLSFGFSL